MAAVKTLAAVRWVVLASSSGLDGIDEVVWLQHRALAISLGLQFVLGAGAPTSMDMCRPKASEACGGRRRGMQGCLSALVPASTPALALSCVGARAPPLTWRLPRTRLMHRWARRGSRPPPRAHGQNLPSRRGCGRPPLPAMPARRAGCGPPSRWRHAVTCFGQRRSVGASARGGADLRHLGRRPPPRTPCRLQCPGCLARAACLCRPVLALPCLALPCLELLRATLAFLLDTCGAKRAMRHLGPPPAPRLAPPCLLLLLPLVDPLLLGVLEV